MQKLMKRKQGQGMTEYIIIVILVALAVIGAVNVFSKSLDAKFQEASDTLRAPGMRKT